MHKHSLVLRLLAHVSTKIKNMIEFQSRVWVIQITDGQFKDESIIVNEDTFTEPMMWMKSKGYCSEMIEKTHAMKRSEILILRQGELEHRIMRAK